MDKNDIIKKINEISGELESLKKRVALEHSGLFEGNWLDGTRTNLCWKRVPVKHDLGWVADQGVVELVVFYINNSPAGFVYVYEIYESGFAYAKFVSGFGSLTCDGWSPSGSEMRDRPGCAVEMCQSFIEERFGFKRK